MGYGYQQQQPQPQYNNFNQYGSNQYGGQNAYNQNQGYSNYNQGGMYNNQGNYNQGGYKGQNFQPKQNYGGGYNNQGGYNSFQNQSHGGQKPYNGGQQTYKPKMQYNSSQGTGAFNNWQAPSDFNPDLNKNKIKNVQTGTQPSLSLNATPFSFKPFVPNQSNPVVDGLKKFGVTADDDVKAFKTLLTDLKKSKDDSKSGVIDLDLFKKVGELKMCQTSESKATDDILKTSVNAALVERDVKETIEAVTKMKKNYSNNRPGGKY